MENEKNLFWCCFYQYSLWKDRTNLHVRVKMSKLLAGVNPGSLHTEILGIYIIHNFPLTPPYFDY